MFKWLKKLFSKKKESEEPTSEELPVVQTPAETVTLTFVPSPAEEQQEMPESRYDTPEYQEFLKKQEPEEPTVEVSRTTEEAAPAEEICEEKLPEEEPTVEIEGAEDVLPEAGCEEETPAEEPTVEITGTPEEEAPAEEEPKADRSKLQF